MNIPDTYDLQQKYREEEERKIFIEKTAIISIIIFIIISVILCIMWLYPKYSVYSQRLAGEAELARADFNRQIAIREAEAKKAAAMSLADAEVIRAQGVAKANKIIGDSLRDNEAYLKYLWITDVSGTKSPTVIYVPTEANLPILEASRLKENK